MAVRSAGFTAIDLDPSELAGQTHALARYLQQIKAHEANKVITGLAATTPTTGSTQTTGDAETDWNVDLSAGAVIVNGVLGTFNVQADFAVHDTDQVPGLDSLDTVVSAIIAEVDSGAVGLIVVHGTAATTASGNAVGPTDAQIEAGLSTAGNEWVKVCELTINRTADTTVTQSQDNTKRPILGVNVSTDFAGFAG
jgi:hypothetical protein